MINSWCNHAVIHEKMVNVDPTTTVMAFVSFFPYPGEPAGHTLLLHAPAQCPGRLGESTPFDGKAHTFCDDVGSGTASFVEFLEEAFESTGLLEAHAKWGDFDLGFINNCVEFSVIPLTGRQTYQLPKMI